MHDYTSGPADLSYKPSDPTYTLESYPVLCLSSDQIAGLIAILMVRLGLEGNLTDTKCMIEDFLIGLGTDLNDYDSITQVIGVEKIALIKRVRYLVQLAGGAPKENRIEQRMLRVTPR